MGEYESEKEPEVPKLESRELKTNEIALSNNTKDVVAELAWLEQVLTERLRELESEEPFATFSSFEAPKLGMNNSTAYSELVKKFDLSVKDRLLLVTALAPFISPSLLTSKLRKPGVVSQVRQVEVGGYIDRGSRHFLPTMQTVLFLLCGTDEYTSTITNLQLREQSPLFKEGIVKEETIAVAQDVANSLNQLLSVAQEYLNYLQSGHDPKPTFGNAFPARAITTSLSWQDLIVPESTRAELDQLVHWIRHKDKMKEISHRFDIASPCLFYGPPGTGKTLASTVLGKHFDRQVFKVDLSMIVSKYIGETEKNLSYLFDRADGKDWILLFDEADALFSKRTGISNSNDKWANLEVSYLLQRMEEHRGLTILTTNLKGNMDPAMLRRFRYIVKFPKPAEEERKQLWQNTLPSHYKYDDDVSFSQLCKENLTGANISNIIVDCCLTAERNDVTIINKEILKSAIARELRKEDRTITFYSEVGGVPTTKSQREHGKSQMPTPFGNTPNH